MTAEAPADTGGGRVRRRARRTPLAVLGIYLGLAAAAAIAAGTLILRRRRACRP